MEAENPMGYLRDHASHTLHPPFRKNFFRNAGGFAADSRAPVNAFQFDDPVGKFDGFL